MLTSLAPARAKSWGLAGRGCCLMGEAAVAGCRLLRGCSVREPGPLGQVEPSRPLEPSRVGRLTGSTLVSRRGEEKARGEGCFQSNGRNGAPPRQATEGKDGVGASPKATLRERGRLASGEPWSRGPTPRSRRAVTRPTSRSTSADGTSGCYKTGTRQSAGQADTHTHDTPFGDRGPERS